jgi:flagellar protein FliL
MTDQAAVNTDLNEEEGGEAAGPTKKWSGKRIVLFIILPLIVILSGGAAGAYFMGFIGGPDKAAEEAAKAEEQKHVRTAIFVDVPDLLVNLNTDGRRTSFLKLKVALEVAKEEDAPALEQRMPRVVDTFQGYLRELRAEDLRGSAGLYRLREDLLARAKTAAEPAEVTDVLFKEMLVQ